MGERRSRVILCCCGRHQPCAFICLSRRNQFTASVRRSVRGAGVVRSRHSPHVCTRCPIHPDKPDTTTLLVSTVQRKSAGRCVPSCSSGGGGTAAAPPAATAAHLHEAWAGLPAGVRGAAAAQPAMQQGATHDARQCRHISRPCLPPSFRRGESPLLCPRAHVNPPRQSWDGPRIPHAQRPPLPLVP